jgi:RNA polymerase sigma-70 factor (ECF subfamily)
MDESILLKTYHDAMRPLYEYVSRRCGTDRGLAEDVTQETWLRAVVAWKKSGLPDNPLAWLKTVSRNLLINYYRKAPLISLDALAYDWERQLLGDGADGGEPDHGAVVTWGLARLRPIQSRLIEAYHIDGMKVGEIAKEFGLSERAVEGRLRRARLKLRKILQPLVGTSGGLS